MKDNTVNIPRDDKVTDIPANNCLFKVNKRNIRKRSKIYSKLIIKTPEKRQWRRSGVFIVNFEHISHFHLLGPLLTLSW